MVITDLRTAQMDGIVPIKELQRRYPALPVILMTAHGTIPDAEAATCAAPRGHPASGGCPAGTIRRRYRPARVLAFDDARDECTRSYLARLLQLKCGNVNQTVRLARRNRTDFYTLLARHQIAPEAFQSARDPAYPRDCDRCRTVQRPRDLI